MSKEFVFIIFFFVAAAFPLKTFAARNDDPLEQKLDRIVDAAGSYFNKVDTIMTSTSKSLSNTDLSGEKAHSILADLCAKWPGSAIECAIIKANGIASAVEPAEFQKFQGTDYSRWPQVAGALAAEKPVVGRIFKPHEILKTLMVQAYFWPIYSQKGKFNGMLTVLVTPLKALDSIVLSEMGPNAYNVWILDTDGTFIYSRYHKEIGEDLTIVPDEAPGSSISKLISEIISTPNGRGYLTLPPTGNANPMIQRCLWKTVSAEGVERRIAILGTRQAQ